MFGIWVGLRVDMYVLDIEYLHVWARLGTIMNSASDNRRANSFLIDHPLYHQLSIEIISFWCHELTPSHRPARRDAATGQRVA